MMSFDTAINRYFFTCDGCGKLEERESDTKPNFWYVFEFQSKTNHACNRDCCETIIEKARIESRNNKVEIDFSGVGHEEENTK